MMTVALVFENLAQRGKGNGERARREERGRRGPPFVFCSAWDVGSQISGLDM
jgi:hypothetical protein